MKFYMSTLSLQRDTKRLDPKGLVDGCVLAQLRLGQMISRLSKGLGVVSVSERRCGFPPGMAGSHVPYRNSRLL